MFKYQQFLNENFIRFLGKRLFALQRI